MDYTNIARLRAEEGLTQEQLGAKLGISQAFVNKLERGITPEIKNLKTRRIVREWLSRMQSKYNMRFLRAQRKRRKKEEGICQ